MSRFRPRFGRWITRRWALSAAALLAAVGLTTQPSSAAVACRADPVVHLSNGANLRIGVQIQDAASDVQQISYVLHVPAGVSAQQIYYPVGNALTAVESLQVIADNQPGYYDTYTVVTTGASGVQVSAYTQFASQSLFTGTGLSGQTIHTQTVTG